MLLTIEVKVAMRKTTTGHVGLTKNIQCFGAFTLTEPKWRETRSTLIPTLTGSLHKSLQLGIFVTYEK